MLLSAMAANPIPELSFVITDSRQITKERQAQRVNRLITQVPLIPERQRGAHARYGRDAADADQQEIVVHDKYRNACPPAYVSGSLG